MFLRLFVPSSMLFCICFCHMHLNKVGEHKQMVLIGFFSFAKLFCHFRVCNSYLRFSWGLHLTSEVSVFGNQNPLPTWQKSRQVAALQAVAQVTQVGFFQGWWIDALQRNRTWHPFKGAGLGGGNSNMFYFSPLLVPGEMIKYDSYFSNGLKPPTSGISIGLST